jgi:hypothetical protein
VFADGGVFADMEERIQTIKSQIVAALNHPEAEEGLYFNNLRFVYEEEERPVVLGEEQEILDALHELIEEGVVVTRDSNEELIFALRNGTAR